MYDWDTYALVDMSKSCTDLSDVDTSDRHQVQEYLDHQRLTAGRPVLYGGYLEQRSIYDRSDIFSDGGFRRNVHLGLDIWINDGTTVHAIADGYIYGQAVNAGRGNYGPTIIMKHECHERGIFFALYGHLDEVGRYKLGDKIRMGQKIARLGSPEVNGDYPPHLHLQIIKDLHGAAYDYPGVCSESHVAGMSANCPDPLKYIWLPPKIAR